jgi:hypothetical protein
MLPGQPVKLDVTVFGQDANRPLSDHGRATPG